MSKTITKAFSTLTRCVGVMQGLLEWTEVGKKYNKDMEELSVTFNTLIEKLNTLNEEE